MTLEPPLLLLIALAAIVVAAMAAHRSGEHADRMAGRRPVGRGTWHGPLGAVGDMLDRSVAAYGLRKRFGRSTATHAQRRAAEAQAALVARAEEIRQHRTGAPSVRPARLVVSGRAGEQVVERRSRPTGPTTTLPFELVMAVFAFVVVVGVVVAIWPRGATGGVLSATATPSSTATPALASPAPASAPPSTSLKP